MNRDEELQLIERARQATASGQTDEADTLSRVPVSRYLDPERLDDERALIKRSAFVVGFASQTRHAGDFVTHDESGIPLVVIRGDDGELRGFVNACRHRGTQLLDEGAGSCKQIVCPYHAWRYGLDGALAAIPHKAAFEGLERDQHALVPVPVTERYGLLWAHGAPSAFVEDLEVFDDHQLFAPSVRDRVVNWKLMFDTSYEAYHFRTAHAATIAPFFYDNVAIVDVAAPHVRAVLPKRSLESLPEDETRWRLRDHANILYGLFPNTILLVQADHAMVLSVWPLDPEHSRIRAGMLIPPEPLTAKSASHWDKNQRIFWNAIDEDIAMAERMQRTLRSGANEHLTLGRNEWLISAFHRWVDEAI